MKTTDYINEKNLTRLKEDIGEDRFIHSLAVMKECAKLADRHRVDKNKAMIAGLYHDCGKLLKKNRAYELIEKYDLVIKEEFLLNYQLLHPVLGYYLGKIFYDIEDEEILNAIYYHTTLRENATKLEKIVYIADAVEPNRFFTGVDKLRKMAYKDLDRAVLISLDKTIVDVINKGKHLGIDSILSRNYLLREIQERN